MTVPANNICNGLQEKKEGTRESIQAFIHGHNKEVLTFTGYSGAKYETPNAMLDAASRILDKYDPSKTLVNIGATEVGIGAVYEIAKQKGFTTMGIVSTLARDENVSISKCVDYVFYVKDSTWGGKVPNAGHLSPTSDAIVGVSASFVAIGGGDVTKDEMLAARKTGKPVTFIPADMNHRIAIEKARKKGKPEPTDFRGSAQPALQPE